MKKKMQFIISLVLLFFVLYFSTSVWILAGVKDTLRTIYLHSEQDEQIQGIYVAPEAMKKFYRHELYPSSNNDKIDFSLSMGRVLHFFFVGKIWITYKYESFDSETNKLKYGSHAPMTLTVKLSKGHWKIINKYEKP